MESKEFETALDTKFAGLQDQLKAMQDANTTDKAELKKVHDSIKAHGEMLQEIEEAQASAKGASFDSQFKDFLKANESNIRDIYNSEKGELRFEPDTDLMEKAVGDLTRANGTVGTVPAYNDVNLGNVALRNDNAMLDLCSRSNTSKPSHPYTQITGYEGDVAFTAEGGTKSQLDFDWITNYATPFKPAGYEVFTEEVIDDIPRMRSVASKFLKDRHDLVRVNGVYFGDGTGANPTGSTVNARVFQTSGDLLNTLPLDSTNIMDVINACITDIWTTHNWVDETNYRANLACVNPIDFFVNFVAAKDANGLPLYPQASLFNQVTIGGVKIIPWEKIPAGKIYVADQKVVNITDYKPYSVRIGWINAQMIENKFTMVGESRGHVYTKSNDLQALIYDDIATIQTYIEKLT